MYNVFKNQVFKINLNIVLFKITIGINEHQPLKLK